MSGAVLDSSPYSVYQASEDLKGLEWPEEGLTSTTNEGGGFYPARLGETFDDGRFVITRKLGWGGFSSVWLARDRKYVLVTISLYPEFTG
jgi:serine/threonine-protein kinase SRPK3